MLSYRQLVDLFDRGKRRFVLVGTEAAGAVAGLDLEGRIYAVVGGKVLNRVNPDAFLGTSSRAGYLNPGGDGFWPAPEGSCLGYEYPTGAWRVPPGLTGARYWVTEKAADAAVIRAEVDLVNAAGLGIPTAFERRVRVATDGPGTVVLTITERLEYLGAVVLDASRCLLIPWTLAQFDCGPGCDVVFPAAETTTIWDFYDPSPDQRSWNGGLWRTRTEGGRKYQIGLAPDVQWIEFRNPAARLTVRRSTAPLTAGLAHGDIADRAPGARPEPIAVRYSVYSDAGAFMEIEAAGGSPATLGPGTATDVTVTTRYALG